MRFLVITTIYPPNNAIKSFEMNSKKAGIKFVVAGDKKNHGGI